MGTSSFALRGSKGDGEALVLAHVAGIENHRNTCYFNSVLQCVLKCRFFTRPLLSLDVGALPGPLSYRIYAMARHLSEQTLADVQTRAVYPFARAVLRCLCELAPLFAEDDQQDSQELFLCMINGVADEFDKGKSEEEKKKGPRLSFEGLCARRLSARSVKVVFHVRSYSWPSRFLLKTRLRVGCANSFGRCIFGKRINMHVKGVLKGLRRRNRSDTTRLSGRRMKEKRRPRKRHRPKRSGVLTVYILTPLYRHPSVGWAVHWLCTCCDSNRTAATSKRLPGAWRSPCRLTWHRLYQRMC
ncbi:putative ubiquitin hydrolase [Trypanosoma cruzi]|uniref:Putative ubiquitin hydrolase n=1 Tax=Trypanosoma cruzi TaxID=5693 RepID=A0A2V2WZS2_TRYCR|nr:putative ubiquitin hydrolase [Trypanosoma cruzi]